jgi:hypothetical protein
MTYQRGDENQDVFNKDPNLNLATCEFNPILKMYFPKENGLFQCMKCDWVQKRKEKCEICGSPNFKRVNKRTRILPPSKGAIAHFTRKVTLCFNTETDQTTGLVTRHPLDEKTRLVVNIPYGEANTETYCGTCGLVYSWPSGRVATAQELADARAGKIPLKTVKPVLQEIESE